MSARLVRSLLSGHERFVVTGASGWLGRTALELLADALGRERFGDAVVAFASTAKTVTLCDGTVAYVRPLDELQHLGPAPTYLLHFAYLTRDRISKIGAPAYIHANSAITATVVGAIESLRPLAVFGSSSGAVYTRHGTFVTDVTGDPYAALKHLEELAIRRAAADVGARSVVARIFSVTGAYMTKPSRYAIGDLLLQALAGGPITIRATNVVERSYCAARDVVTLALCCLLRGSNDDVVFDTAGEVIEIGDLARMVTQVLGVPEMAIARSWDRSADTDRYVGEGRQMSKLAEAEQLRLQTLQDQIRETASYLRLTTSSRQRADQQEMEMGTH